MLVTAVLLFVNVTICIATVQNSIKNLSLTVPVPVEELKNVPDPNPSLLKI